jgi:mediator of RNA polymerase II transcription subunit 18
VDLASQFYQAETAQHNFTSHACSEAHSLNISIPFPIMHELLLFGQISHAAHDQVLKVLAGIAAMQPLPLKERHLIFKPFRSPESLIPRTTQKPSAQAPGSKTQVGTDLFYLQLVGHLSAKPMDSSSLERSDFQVKDSQQAETSSVGQAVPPGPTSVTPKASIDFSACPWTLEYRDLPEVPGRRPVTSRLMNSTPIKTGNPLRFVEELGYSFDSEYLLTGYQLVHNNMVIQLQKAYQVVPDFTMAPLSVLPAVENLEPLDSSGVHVLQAAIRVQDGTKSETMITAMNELKALKETLKGIVDLEIGDRLALDTRVR